MNKLLEMKNKQKELAIAMRSLHTSIGEATWTDEQRSEWGRLETEILPLEDAISREETLRSQDANVAKVNAKLDKVEGIAERHGLTSGDAWRSFLAKGRQEMNAEERSAFDELRAQGIGSNAKGGYTVPTEFWNRVVDEMKAFGGLANNCYLLGTSDGRVMEWVQTDGTNDMGSYIGENTQVVGQDVDFGAIALGVVKITSNVILVSAELLQDSAVDIEGIIARRIASRLARKEADAIVNADGGTVSGVVTPKGLKESVTLETPALAAAGISYDDFVDLKHSIDPAYRGQGKYMFHDSTLKALKKLKDSEGRPLWLPAIAGVAPSTIDGTEFFIDQACDEIGAGKTTVYYGDFQRFILRRVSGMELKRLTERYADFDQVGFLAFFRFGCVLEDLAAVAALKHPAS